ncbi:excalibur calcium-binding domain-containing protein [Psychrobacter sp. UBA3480]|uniref:excalibur calcium-binding domain-containing protein n=1 Tax=Psychrobacter sp. UBA3480 TaxID=1947350 RepID=UPI0025F843B3|nr:excalibur calcium-binding domain-containing protein [Psychrobacter sp. UBA3480]
MKKLILAAAFSMLALLSNAGVTTIDNPFQGNMVLKEPVKVDHPLFAKGTGGAQCKGLPSTCGQMANCEQAKQALKCGYKRLDRDKDGVPCESICPGG